jgi:uncharacterized membrane protein
MTQQETKPPDQATPGDEGQQGDGAQHGRGGGGASIADELKQAVREAALEVLGPAARQAANSAAQYAVSKGPEIVTKKVMPAFFKTDAGGLAHQATSNGVGALAHAGGIGGLAGKLLSKLRGRGGGGVATGWGRGRRMPVQQVIYVSVPVKRAYNGWTEYKQWPRYMQRANQVDAQVNEQEARVKVTEKMWGFKRPFTVEVVAQRPDEHIKWNSTEGTKHTGVINFHELGPRLTLIEVNLDHAPSGPLEKLARGTRFVKRAVRADFHRFQGWIEMKSDQELAELEGWRGTIEGGQVITSHEDAVEQERREDESEPQGPADDDREPVWDGDREAHVAADAQEPEAADAHEPEAPNGHEPEAAADGHEPEIAGAQKRGAGQPRG